MKPRARWALLGACGLLLAAGCGRPVLRLADPSLGDYYTKDEFKRLRQEQRDEYCDDLAKQDSSYVAALGDLRLALAETDARRERAGAAADSLTRLADSLSAVLAEARAHAPARGLWSAYVVRPGDCLWRIAADDRGYGDGRAWRRIYEANRARIRDPDLIYPGQEFQIPR